MLHYTPYQGTSPTITTNTGAISIQLTALRPDEQHILQQAARFFAAQHQQAYLTGGSVRDLLRHTPCTDWDIVTTGDAPRLARQLANKLHGFYAHLHAKASRVVCQHGDSRITLDIAPLAGSTIEEDLHLRDFTINAIALPLDAIISAEPCTPIDPLDGVADLRASRLRAVRNDIFQRDPLRLLRAVRFMMRYNLSLDPTTEQMLTSDASLLTLSAPERIHDELYALLPPDGAAQRLRFLDQHHLFTTLLPEFIPARGMRQPELHHWDVLEHSIETVTALERLHSELQRPAHELPHSPLSGGETGDLVALQSLLHEAEQQQLFELAMLSTAPMKLAALLHDIGKPITRTVDEDGAIHFYHHPQAGVPLAQEIMKRLSTSAQDRRLVQQVVAHHMRPGQLSGTPLTPRAIRRFFVDLGNTGIHVALISLADHLSMRGPLPLTEAWSRHLATVCLLLTRYIRERNSILPPRIIQSGELIRRFNLTPGPLIGQLLDHIAEAQADGQIHSKDDALWLAEEFLQKQK
ncbi:MAG: HD domain-containing protein [Ktedonobacteraceae bacterium]|nr:HD domain-containing protein [Ktedonobacteraceae bacterium]MBO0792318.1 HD domain-containing protein [Ktedonobacteraceae bacterium]